MSIIFLGLIAGTLTTVSLLPQLIKVLKSRSTKDISLPMFILFTTGVVLWFIYGICIHAVPIVITNGITFIFSAMILFLKLRYK